MRLLAYGGTSYSTRCRIGDWPSIPEGALGDRSALSEQSLTFGVGLLDDQQPFLIIRQKQNAEERGGYAFSLLLDPGRGVWERFQWNGSHLALSLFGGGNPSGRELLLRPEQFTKNQLNGLLEELEPIPLISRCEGTEDFPALLVGTILLPGPIGVSPVVIGFAKRPTMEQLASMLQCLPPCFRCGFGWLTGGSKENGQAFGSRLVLYDQSTGELGSVSKYLDAGRNLLSAWNIVANDDESKQAIVKRVAVPVWEWKNSFEESYAKFFKGIQLLAECLKPSGSEEDLLEYVEGTFDETGEMADLIRRAARRLALSGSGQFTASRTLSILRSILNQKASIDRATVERLDKQRVIEEFVNRRLQPSASPFQLSENVRVEIWRTLIETENNYSQIPMMLLAGVKDLDPDVNRDQIRGLAKVAVEYSVRSSGALSAWVPFRKNQAISALICDWLQEEALRSVIDGKEGWHLDYLAFARDPGGTRLASLNLPAEHVRGIVEFLLREARGNGQFQDEAAKWLLSLASSPLRREVKLKDKIEIAKTVNQKWTSLLEIWQLYRGRKEESKKLANTEVPERDYLLLELGEMAEKYPGKDPPNLQGLVEFLGSLPEANIQTLSDLRPKLSGNLAPKWLEGWRALDRDTFRREVFRFFLESDESLSESFTLKQFSVEELALLFREILFGGTENDDNRYRGRVGTIFASGDNDEHFVRAIEIAFETDLFVKQSRHDFYRRFAWQAPVLDYLFQFLPLKLQDEVVMICLGFNEEKLQEEAYEIFTLASKPEFQRAPYLLAILRFLLYPEGTTIKNQIGTQKYGLMKAGIIDARLREILGDSIAKEEMDIESGRDFGSHLRTWLKRVKNFVMSHLPKRRRREHANAESAEWESTSGEFIETGQDNRTLARGNPPSIKPRQDDAKDRENDKPESRKGRLR